MLRAESTSSDSLPSAVVRREPKKLLLPNVFVLFCPEELPQQSKTWTGRLPWWLHACYEDWCWWRAAYNQEDFSLFLLDFFKNFFIVRVSTQCSDGWQGKPKVNSKSRANDCPDVGDHPEETKVVNDKCSINCLLSLFFHWWVSRKVCLCAFLRWDFSSIDKFISARVLFFYDNFLSGHPCRVLVTFALHQSPLAGIGNERENSPERESHRFC